MTNSTRVARRGINGRSAVTAAAVAAAVAVSAGASAARAQYRVGADGHLNDVNNRLGSGGYNQGNDASYRSALNNQIDAGNVSGLNYFHGNIQALDPNTLQINSQDAAVQAFTQRSAPVNYAQQSNGQPNFTPYYNQAQYAPPAPANFTATRNNVGIIPAPVVNPLTYTGDNRIPDLNAPVVNATSVLPSVMSATGPGPVNPVGAPGLYAMSPLYGVRQLQPGDAEAESPSYLSRYGYTPRTAGSTPQNNQQQVQRLRAELNAEVPNGAVDNNPNGGTGPGAANGRPGLMGGGSGPGTGDVSAANGAITGQQLRSAQVSGLNVQNKPLDAALPGRQVSAPVGSALSSVTQTLQVPPGKQSQQLAELQRRFAAANPHPTAAQQADQLNQERLALKQAKQTSVVKPGVGGAGGAGGGTPPPPTAANGGRLTFGDSKAAGPNGAGPATPPPGGLPTVVRPSDAAPAAGGPAVDQPFVITSLAAGIRSPGLADLFRQAEGQMRAGQFSQAVDTYDQAGQVVPNNPFVPLGRSFAELGANFYGRAEADLTRAILSEPAVLAGQYDLRGFLGQDRLKFVQTDLGDIAKTEQTARPHLLLAYIAHNTGQDDVTTKELGQAAAKGADAHLLDLMRQAWGLKGGGR